MTARIVLLLLALPAALTAQTLEAPPVVVADGDGGFRYAVHMTYPAGGAYFGGYTLIAGENVAGGIEWIDGFCISFVPGGSVSEFTVERSLIDPAATGLMTFEWFGCDPGFSLSATTLVLGPEVASEPATWSAVKRMYR